MPNRWPEIPAAAGWSEAGWQTGSDDLRLHLRDSVVLYFTIKTATSHMGYYIFCEMVCDYLAGGFTSPIDQPDPMQSDLQLNFKSGAYRADFPAFQMQHGHAEPPAPAG